MDRREFLQVASGAALQAHLPRASRQPNDADLKLWYPSPASNWNEALPIGNGRFGGMIFGGVEKDEVQLNDDTLYSEEPHTGDLPLDVTKDYPEVERLLRSGHYSEAADIITRNWTGRSWPCYQPWRVWSSTILPVLLERLHSTVVNSIWRTPSAPRNTFAMASPSPGNILRPRRTTSLS